MLVYNSYATPNLDNLSPFEVPIGRKAVLAPRFECKPDTPITGTHAKAHENLQEKLIYFRKRLEDRMALMNKDRQHYGFTVGQIVYIYNPSGSQLQTGNRKIQCYFVGPLAIYKCINPNQFLLIVMVEKETERKWNPPGEAILQRMRFSIPFSTANVQSFK